MTLSIFSCASWPSVCLLWRNVCLDLLPTFWGEGDGTPLQYSCLENPMDGGAWKAAVHGVTKSQTWLNNFTFTFHFHALEKEMATHSSVLAWRIPGTEESGGLLSMGSHRFGHDWSNLAAFPQMGHHSLTMFKAICITVGFRKILESDPLRYYHHSNVSSWF